MKTPIDRTLQARIDTVKKLQARELRDPNHGITTNQKIEDNKNITRNCDLQDKAWVEIGAVLN